MPHLRVDDLMAYFKDWSCAHQISACIYMAPPGDESWKLSKRIMMAEAEQDRGSLPSSSCLLVSCVRDAPDRLGIRRGVWMLHLRSRTEQKHQNFGHH